MPEAIIRAAGIERCFPSRPLPLRVLKGADLSLRPQETVAIVGSSGSGKSTLLHVLGCLDRPDGGTLSIDGHDTARFGERELAAFRNRTIGFVFQFHYLLPEFTALENAAMPLLIAGLPRKRALAIAEQLLLEVGLAERLEHRPSELSGGEQQRVAIARALANSPSLILADEPTGNLDHASGELVADLLWRVNADRKVALVIVTHNHEIAARAGRVLELRDGRLSPRP
ncbi:MAG: ABC transporter ATP-binding protein [Candidatus Edwardsbacteria bacterium]|jgi:lipoprotein-releasing system ATP-binding protein|nr:ABC transporter ATP-binding protein [Candidatus Edwardsbacteria bacterium]